MALIRGQEKTQRERLLKLQERLQAKGKDLSKEERKLLDGLNRKYENLKKSIQRSKEKTEKKKEAKAKEKRKSERAERKASKENAWKTAAVAPRDKDDQIIERNSKTGYSKDYFKGVDEDGTVKDKNGNKVAIEVSTGGGEPISKGKTWEQEPEKKRVDQPRSARSGQFTYNSTIGKDKVDKRDRAKGTGDLGEDPRFREDKSGVGEIYEKMKKSGETEKRTYIDKDGNQVTEEKLRGIKKGDVFVLKNGDTVVFTSDISVQQFYKYYMTNLKGEDSDELVNSLMEHGLIMKLGKKFQNRKDYSGETGVRVEEGVGSEALSASEQKEYDDLNRQLKEDDKLPQGDPNKLSPKEKAAKWNRIGELGDKRKAREALGSKSRKKEFDESREAWKTHRKNVTGLENAGIVDEASDRKLKLSAKRGDRLGDIRQFEDLPVKRDREGKIYDKYAPISPTPKPQQEKYDKASIRNWNDDRFKSIIKDMGYMGSASDFDGFKKKYGGLLENMTKNYNKVRKLTDKEPVSEKRIFNVLAQNTWSPDAFKQKIKEMMGINEQE